MSVVKGMYIGIPILLETVSVAPFFIPSLGQFIIFSFTKLSLLVIQFIRDQVEVSCNFGTLIILGVNNDETNSVCLKLILFISPSLF